MSHRFPMIHHVSRPIHHVSRPTMQRLFTFADRPTIERR